MSSGPELLSSSAVFWLVAGRSPALPPAAGSSSPPQATAPEASSRASAVAP
ncbi:hypothetical protein [Streptomyces sp. NPDC007929]|uniref:hypothetical protein n=1 Tax=Streptomyces sp. NPDC007929 TaxID=3364795 RepID=UPI0036EABB37